MAVADTLVLRDAQIGLCGPRADVAIAHKRIRAIGPDLPSDAAEVVDLEGRTLLPGLWDAHVHATRWASWVTWVDLGSAASAQQAADLVADRAHAQEATVQVLRGYGFRDGFWPDQPHRDILDAALPGRPVVLVSNDQHTGWFSSAALTLVGADDHPTGVLRESACHAAIAALPAVPEKDLDRLAVGAVSAAAQRGVTGFLDFEFSDNTTDWARRAQHYALDARVDCAIMHDDLEAAIAAGWRTGDIVEGTGELVTVGPLKLFVDGSLDSRTALCFDQYPDSMGGSEVSHPCGRLEIEPEELESTMAHAAAHGLTCAVHAIGDRANAIALDAFDRLGLPGRIEHAQLLTERDFDRLAMPGLVLGIQPAHAPDDRDIADRHWRGRTKRAYAYADMIAAGATVEIGSDAPVAPLDPWDGIASAIARTDDERDPWHPEQAIALPDALAAASRGRRSVRIGDVADLAIVEGDPAEMGHADLRFIHVAGTLLGGRWTHRTLGT